MRKAETPFLADLVSISLRWVAIVALGLWLGSNELLTTGAILALSTLIIWNLFLSILAVFNRRLPGHRLAVSLTDFAAFAALFALTGGLNAGLNWTGVLPVLTAAIYFEWRGSLVAALAFSAFQTLWSLLVEPLPASASGSILAQAGANLLVGLLAAAGGLGLMYYLRQEYRRQLQNQREMEKRVQRLERDRMRALYGMIETLSATLNHRVVLDTALEQGAAVLGETDEPDGKIVSAVFLFNEGELKASAARHLPPSDMRKSFPALTGGLAEALNSGNPVTLTEPARDPELRALVILQTCQSALLLPLRRGLDAYGVMLFAHSDPAYFNADRIEILEMISHQSIISIQNASLFRDLELEKERIIESQEEARKKLARDLHDGPTQSVAAISMRLNVTRRMMEKDTTAAGAELEKIEELARRTTKEIRHMLFTLRPLALESEGLKAALTTMADKMKDTFEQEIALEVDEAVVEEMEMGKQTVIFYLVEEALNNARKHAQASRIDVRLRYHPKDRSIAVLDIQDNGVGFDVQAVNKAYQKRGSLGMINLRERSELIGALLKLESAPGKGTLVRVFIPLNEEAADRLQRGNA